MNKNTIHNQKHLTLSDRTFIEQELCQESSFKYIATILHKDPTTISKEIRNHRRPVAAKGVPDNCRDCKFRNNCTIHGNDPEVESCPRSSYCTNLCKKCWRENTRLFCSTYIPITCSKCLHAPYVCNSCTEEKNCRINHFIYHAAYAQKQYEKTLVTSRKGINLTPQELQDLNDLISPLVMKGQPLSHIFSVHSNE